MEVGVAVSRWSDSSRISSEVRAGDNHVQDEDQNEKQAAHQDGAEREDTKNPNEENQEPFDYQDYLPAKTIFQFHYNESSTGGRLLADIVSDLASFKAPHDWDKLQQTNQLKTLATSAKRYLDTLSSGEASELLNYSTVEDVSILNKTVARRPVDSSTEAYFFPSEFTPPEEALASIPDMPAELCSMCWSQGRIVQVTETASLMQRSPLLLLHAFCLRLQNEDTAFIRDFIQRHVDFRHRLKTPGHFQSMTPSDTDAVSSNSLLRITTCSPVRNDNTDIGNHPPPPDLKQLESFEPIQPARPEDVTSLCQISSSVLLTFTLPEESASRREEVEFLTTPQALWTILTVNCMRGRSSNSDDTQEAPPTPLAQFLAGIHGALHTQRIDEQHILDTLRFRLAESDDMSLVDDDNFTKSHLYHWVVRTCDKVCHSISTTLRFVDRISKDFVSKLAAEGHATKPPGVEFWEQKWMEEISDLKDLREEFLSCRQDVQERRNALHGATAVLEARLAYQQAERMKVLTYLAIIYLPLGASAGIYSINPLPQSATLGSYFIFLVVLFLVTALVGAGMTNLFSKTSAAAGVSGSFLAESWKLFAGWLIEKYDDHLENYLRYLEAIFTPDNPESSSALALIKRFNPPASRYWDKEWGYARVIFKWFYKFCVRMLFHVIVPWMALPRTLWYRFMYSRDIQDYSWSLCQAIWDTFVIILSPVAVALFICFTCWVVQVDIVATVWHWVRRRRIDRRAGSSA
ncbi:hypothetical protein NM208_g4710 [Fusarium decemcellulare]|uniref:Uncharacterized protein n=1 Tax=Fusarium decemcellulare TaxID=57161 RepID=A0ACC1SJP2_9HYPO|nr:hypothetical protein NM208_g4710 [Fusarium decemcellulare]